MKFIIIYYLSNKAQKYSYQKTKLITIIARQKAIVLPAATLENP